MKNFDYGSVDGQFLKTFLVLLEEGSTTRAAERLEVTQSAVSHSLGRLRRFFGDPLFVRSGQQFAPRERALSLKAPVQSVLDGIIGLTHDRPFDPQSGEMAFVIAANDMQRDLIFPELTRALEEEGVRATFEFIPSGHPTVAMMRDDRCDLALTPFPPDASDIVQKQVLVGQMMCFFDSEMRDPPSDWDTYCQADHVTVRFPDGGTSRRALTGVDTSAVLPARISVSNFNAIPEFVKGTRRLATELDLMKLCSLSALDMGPLPLPSNPVGVYASWHRRNDSEPAHVWMRGRVEDIAGRIRRSTARQDLST
ncbi:MAG: LysR family transcriptional regulator [Paracoccaceae bacterium]